MYQIIFEGTCLEMDIFRNLAAILEDVHQIGSLVLSELVIGFDWNELHKTIICTGSSNKEVTLIEGTLGSYASICTFRTIFWVQSIKNVLFCGIFLYGFTSSGALPKIVRRLCGWPQIQKSRLTIQLNVNKITNTWSIVMKMETRVHSGKIVILHTFQGFYLP